jgi:protein arginine kinase
MLIDRIDSELDQNLHYAFSADWGYLTACPTNVGTGIRISVLIHLVGLARGGGLSQVLGSASKLGLAVRGLHGEGTSASCAFFQISNQTTLGQTEEDIAYTVERVANQIVCLELAARRDLAETLGVRLDDEVHRSYGVLTNARSITSGELTELCSSLRLGVALGLIDNVDLAAVNRLLFLVRPGHVMFFRGEGPTADERDRARADLVRRELGAAQ